jgi:hypothetical protein
MVLDSIRTIVIWAFSIAIGWQHFHYLQVVGFTSLIFGMCVYNDLMMGPLRAIGRMCGCISHIDDGSHEPIINREADEA